MIMSVSENTMMLMTMNQSDSRSISPMTPSPSREMRGIRLFRAISRKLARRSQDDLNFEEDSRSSSTDSSSSGRCSRSKKTEAGSCSSSNESGFRSVSPHHISSSSSDAGSDSLNTKAKQSLSASAESIRKVFQNLTVSTRSRSCTNTKEQKRKSNKTATPPKKILRSPVSYTYVKGLSGLPTQRIPKPTRIYTTNNCGCSIQYMAALNR